MKVTKLHENVYYYTGVIKNPAEFIENVEKIDQDPDTHVAITAWMEDFSERKRKDLLPKELDRVTGKSSAITQSIIKQMQDAVYRISHAFVKDRGLNISPNISPMLDLCKYEPGGRIGPHFDAQDGDKSLLYTIVMYFNDDMEGGEVSFSIMDDNKGRPGDDFINDPNIDFWIKPEAGSALVFPSTYPYIHQSHKVTKGNKYMSTSFIFVEGYDPFNHEHVKKYRLSA